MMHNIDVWFMHTLYCIVGEILNPQIKTWKNLRWVTAIELKKNWKRIEKELKKNWKGIEKELKNNWKIIGKELRKELKKRKEKRERKVQI